MSGHARLCSNDVAGESKDQANIERNTGSSTVSKQETKHNQDQKTFGNHQCNFLLSEMHWLSFYHCHDCLDCTGWVSQKSPPSFNDAIVGLIYSTRSSHLAEVIHFNDMTVTRNLATNQLCLEFHRTIISFQHYFYQCKISRIFEAPKCFCSPCKCKVELS